MCSRPHLDTLSPVCSLTAQLTRCESSAAAVKAVLVGTEASFSPRLPGLTKLMGKFTKDGEWLKALAIYESLPSIGLHPDTTITNAAITACDKGAPPRAARCVASKRVRAFTQDSRPWRWLS